jgi:hypothetical protein
MQLIYRLIKRIWRIAGKYIHTFNAITLDDLGCVDPGILQGWIKIDFEIADSCIHSVTFWARDSVIWPDLASASTYSTNAWRISAG